MGGTMRVALAALAVLTLAPAALAQEQGFERPYWLDRSVIEVIGRAQIEAQPDEARFSVTFREVAREALAASQAAADRVRLATAAMRSRGGDALQIRSNAEINAIYEEYRNREGERQSSERADQVVNYVVSITLNVTVSDTARAASVRAAAMAVGPQEVGELRFSLRETAPLQRRVYGAAVEDAAARARIAAGGVGAQLGRLLALQEGQGPCLGRWNGASSRSSGGAQGSQSTGFDDSDEEVVVTGSRINSLRLTPEDIARMQLPEDLTPVTLSSQVCAVYAVAP